MLKDTPDNRWKIRIVILIFRSWPHICLSYTLVNLWRFWPRLLHHITLWRAYCAAEAGFLLFFVWYRRFLQKPAIHPPKRSDEERRALFDKVYAEIRDPVKFLRGWFKGADIKDIGLEQLHEFLIWSFWDGRADDVDEGELQDYVVKIQQLAPELSFREGSGSATSLRLTMDEFDIDYRTLAWYMLIMLLDTMCFATFMSKGYRYHRTANTGLSIFPPRPGALLAQTRSESERVSYWLTRPHTSNTRLPILYFHGIGIGMITYSAFFQELDEALNAGRSVDDHVSILMIEMPQISSRLMYRGIPRPTELLEDFTAILDANKYERFVLAGHSYGSVLSTYMLRDARLSSRIASTLLVDPVTIMLHMPDVAYNFTVRPPVRANEWQLWFFASKDPGVAHTLGRNFFWYENLLWRDCIYELVNHGKMNITVSLGSDDLIIDAQAIGDYLIEHVRPVPALVDQPDGEQTMKLQTGNPSQAWKSKKWSGAGLEILWWQGFDHASVYDETETRGQLIKVLTEYSQAR